MSKGGWARLMKQQQQQEFSTQSQFSDDNEYQVHKYKNIISSKQQLAHMNVSTASTASSLSMLQVDQGDIKPSKLLQIVRRWKAQARAKQITPRPHRSTTTSTSCSRLNFVPLSCITFSSIQLYSDEEEIEGEDGAAGNDIDIVISGALSPKSTEISAPGPLNHQSRSSDTVQSSHRHANMEDNMAQYCTLGKERQSTCERKEQATARRALSCPKLSSPLSACTAFPSMQGDIEGEEEELESLKPQEEEGGRMKLRRSSSSPLRRYSISKQATIPKGYLALYVGEERRRFLVKANLLNHPLFSILLEKAKEEFGFDQKGGLNIPCDIPFFQHIMLLVQSN